MYGLLLSLILKPDQILQRELTVGLEEFIVWFLVCLEKVYYVLHDILPRYNVHNKFNPILRIFCNGEV
jgi:hypothetical protein